MNVGAVLSFSFQIMGVELLTLTWVFLYSFTESSHLKIYIDDILN
jgi:hypothetical protein